MSDIESYINFCDRIRMEYPDVEFDDEDDMILSEFWETLKYEEKKRYRRKVYRTRLKSEELK